MNEKKLYQIIKEDQVIAVLLSGSVKDCENYILRNNLSDDLEYVQIEEVSKKQIQEEDNVVPLMIARKSNWYDLRHYRHLYIYDK